MKASHENLLVAGQFALVALAIVIGAAVFLAAIFLMAASVTATDSWRVNWIVGGYGVGILAALVYCVFGARKKWAWAILGLLISPPIFLFLVSWTTHA